MPEGWSPPEKKFCGCLLQNSKLHDRCPSRMQPLWIQTASSLVCDPNPGQQLEKSRQNLCWITLYKRQPPAHSVAHTRSVAASSHCLFPDLTLLPNFSPSSPL